LDFPTSKKQLIIDKRSIMLENEWEFYENNRDELVEKYCGKYIVISGNKVVSVYNDENEAYFETIKTIPLGSFMIHHVIGEEEVFQLSPFIGV
jgi:hypothetical protein